MQAYGVYTFPYVCSKINNTKTKVKPISYTHVRIISTWVGFYVTYGIT